jgi:ABC-type multidrug transport system fused ATPase/permease subunit
MPAMIGLAIDQGVAAKDTGMLVKWTAVMLGIGLVQAVAGIMRHRFAVTNWLTAAYRTVQLVARQATHLGATLPKRVATGEVVAIGTNDLSHLGNAMDVTARAAGAVVSFLVVAVILLRTSVTLGLLVLLGVPLLLLAIGPLLKPLQRRNMAQREMMGELSNLATDIVGGLRVLRGIGGGAMSTATCATPRRSARPGSRSAGSSRCSTPCRSSCPASSWSSWSGSAPASRSRAGSPPASWSPSTATPPS